jgi:hypothetical protein
MGEVASVLWQKIMDEVARLFTRKSGILKAMDKDTIP